MKDYNINKKTSNGVAYDRITFVKNGKRIFDMQWRPGDEEAKAKAIRSADLCIIRHDLNYNTRKLKPVKKGKKKTP